MNYNISIEQLAENPEALLDAIDAALEDAEPASLPLTFLSAENDKDSPYRRVVNKIPFHGPLERILNQYQDSLHTWICTDKKYCQLSEEHSSTIDLIKAVVDSFVSASFMMPIPLATVATYCVQSCYFDRICDCKKK